MSIIAYILLLSYSFFSCSGKQNKEERNVKNESKEDDNVRTVVIQPFEGINRIVVDSLSEGIAKVVPGVSIKEPVVLPSHAYYAERNRYRADSLNLFLWSLSIRKTIVLGVTDKDISTTLGKHKDWGIIGMSAYIPSHACVVSTFRLSKKNLNDQLYKVTIHELGHAEGLYHCTKERTCIMRDYEGGNLTDELTGFCSFCKARLVRHGWKL